MDTTARVPLVELVSCFCGCRQFSLPDLKRLYRSKAKDLMEKPTDFDILKHYVVSKDIKSDSDEKLLATLLLFERCFQLRAKTVDEDDINSIIEDFEITYLEERNLLKSLEEDNVKEQLMGLERRCTNEVDGNQSFCKDFKHQLLIKIKQFNKI